MAQPLATRQIINATEGDLKQNRLGLMSQAQVDALQLVIDGYQERMRELLQRTITAGAIVTIAVVILLFVRVLILPLAIVIELVVVSGMIYVIVDFNRYIQQLMLDHDARVVRIVKGRVSRYAMRAHPLYHVLRVEVQSYKLLDEAMLEQFGTGELYQLYALPQSRVIIAAEKTGEKGTGYLN